MYTRVTLIIWGYLWGYLFILDINNLENTVLAGQHYVEPAADYLV